MTNRSLAALAVIAFLVACSDRVDEPVKIGMVTTLSTKAGYLGEDIRDGFQLAIDQGDGKLGGIPVELMVDDDGRKPGKGKQIAERYIKRDKAMILTGIVFSNVAMAVVPKVVRHIGKNDAGQNFCIVPLDIAFSYLFALLGFAPVVVHHQLNGDPAQLSASLVDGQLETVTDILSQMARQRGYHADLDRCFGGCRTDGQSRRQGQHT